jgi:hypothetical protein
MTSVRGGRAARFFPAALVAVVIAFGLYLDHAASFEDPAAVAMKETAMNPRTPGPRDDAARAKHGPRSEVTWEGGSGRQPYANQGEEEAAEPGPVEVAEGNRGDRSGRNLDQMTEARRKP